MTEEQQIKLQAFVDGELPESDSRDVAAWIARDREATALLGELRNTRRALKDFEPARTLSESREFYWSRIQREIERSTPAPAPNKTVSPFRLLRRILVPIGAVAVLALAGIFTVRQLGGGVHPVQVNAILGDAGALTYRDEAQGITVVWLSYPAEKKLAQSASTDRLPAK